MTRMSNVCRRDKGRIFVNPGAGISPDPFRFHKSRRRFSHALPPHALVLPASPESGEPSIARCFRRRETTALAEKAANRVREGRGRYWPAAVELESEIVRPRAWWLAPRQPPHNPRGRAPR